jgi:hypothetical protein
MDVLHFSLETHIFLQLLHRHKVIKNTFLYCILHFDTHLSLNFFEILRKSKIFTFGENTKLLGSANFQNVWKFLFNLLWTLSIIDFINTVQEENPVYLLVNENLIVSKHKNHDLSKKSEKTSIKPTLPYN